MSVIPTLPIVNVRVGPGFGSKTIQLPAVSTTNIDSFLIRDYLGNCSFNSNGQIHISSTGLDTFDTISSFTLTTPYQSIKVLRNLPNRWSIQQDYQGGTPVFNFLQFDNGASTILSQYTLLNEFEIVDGVLECTSNKGSIFTGNIPGTITPYPTKSFQTSFTFTIGSNALSNGFCFVMYGSPTTQGAVGDATYLGYGYDGWDGNKVGVDQLTNSLALRLTLNPTLPTFKVVPTSFTNNAYFSNVGNGIFIGDNRIIAYGQENELASYKYRDASLVLGESWIQGAPPNMISLNGMTYGAGNYVAVGSASLSQNQIQRTGSIITPSWSNLAVPGFSIRGNDIYAEGANIVAVGEGTATSGSNTMMYSINYGSNWTRITQANGAFSNGGFGVTYVGGMNPQWVVVGCNTDSNTIKYTGAPAGTWSNFTGSLFPQVGYGITPYESPGNKWIAVGKAPTEIGTILYNSNTTAGNFFEINSGGFNIAGFGIAYNASYFDPVTFINTGMWIAVGEHVSSATGLGTIQWSTDGSNFYPANQGFNVAGYGVVWNNFTSRWVAVGDDGPSGVSIKYSDDGSNWSNATSGTFPRYGYGITVALGNYYAVGSNATGQDTILKSMNGTSWATPITGSGGFSVAGRGISYMPGLMGTNLAVVGESSPPNTTMQRFDDTGGSVSLVPFEAAPGFTGQANGVAFMPSPTWLQNTFVAVGTDSTPTNTVKYSTDNGVSWTNSVNAPFTAAYGVAPVGNTMLALGNASVSTNTICTSTDGSNWNPILSGGFSIGGRSLFYKNTLPLLVVAVGEDGTRSCTIQYSGDGANFSNVQTGGFSTIGKSVTFDFNRSLWIATGMDENPSLTIQISEDGVNWRSGTNIGYTVAGNGILYNSLDSNSYAVGQNLISNAQPYSPIQYTAMTSGVDICARGVISSISAQSGALPSFDYTNGHPVQVKLQGADGILSYTLRDTVTNATYSSNVSTVQDQFGTYPISAFSSFVGSNAYYGFTGTNNGSNESRIYNWSLSANPYP